MLKVSACKRNILAGMFIQADHIRIRINDQYRVCFRAEGNSFYDVEIVDYH